MHTMSSRELIRRLEAAGWRQVRAKGSHRQFAHPSKPGVITVPHPRKDLGIGLVKAMLEHAGLSS
jgi:predicted RNA binding protein YcfA (HicA-like mRNA interferase family)